MPNKPFDPKPYHPKRELPATPPTHNVSTKITPPPSGHNHPNTCISEMPAVPLKNDPHRAGTHLIPKRGQGVAPSSGGQSDPPRNPLNKR